MQILVATLRGAVHQQQRAAAYAALLPSLAATPIEKVAALSSWVAPLVNSAAGEQQRWSPRGRPWPRGRPRGRPRGHILKSLALASKPQVLGLGLEAFGPRKLPCLWLEDSTIFEPLKFC